MMFYKLLLLIISCLSFAQTQSIQENTLRDLFISTNGQNWKTTWNLSSPVCSRFGVNCTNGVLSSLFLSNNDLQGTIPLSISNLNLINLDLSNNKLFGSIPFIKSSSSILLKGNQFNCPVINYNTWSKTTDRNQYSAIAPLCKGSQVCISDVINGTAKCVGRSTSYLSGSLQLSKTWKRTSIKQDKTCCDQGKDLVPYSFFSFSVSSSDFYEILVTNFESEDADSYLHVFSSSFNPTSSSSVPNINLISVNDDISDSYYLSKSNVYLSNTMNYFVVVSSFASNSVGKFYLSIKGPSNFQLSMKCMAETMNNIIFTTTAAGLNSIGKCANGYFPDHNGTITRECLSNGEWSSFISGQCSTPSLFTSADINFITSLVQAKITPINEENLSQSKLIQDQSQTIQQQGQTIQQQAQQIQSLLLIAYQQEETIRKLSNRQDETEMIASYRRSKYVAHFGTGAPTNTIRSANVVGDRLYVIHYTHINVYNKNNYAYIEKLLTQTIYCMYSFLMKEGDLLISDRGRHVIYKISQSSPSILTIFMGKVDDTSVLHTPSSVAIDDDGCIIIAEGDPKRVRIFDPTGKTVLQTFTGFHTWVQSVKISPYNKDVYISDHDNLRIVILRKVSFGNYQWLQERNVGFTTHSITFDKFGNYLLPDYHNSRVMIYERDGTFISSFATHKPLDVFTIDNSSTFLVTDHANSGVNVFTTSK